jgi:4,5-dihydroxyphthalate decarboxylase
MSKLNLSVAVGDYDRTRPLIDGVVEIDGVKGVFLALEPEEIFFRAFRHEEFDICELSLSSYTLKVSRGEAGYIGIPVFPSRAFRHTSFYVRRDSGISSPADLKGKRVGLPEYQLTACVWARALLADDYGIDPSDIVWVRGGIDTPGRVEKLSLSLPDNICFEMAPAEMSLSHMLVAGDIDAMIAPRQPSAFEEPNAPVRWLFEDPTAAAADYYSRTGVFPIMHLLGVRRSLVERHPWLPATVQKAFTKAKDIATRRLADNSAAKATLPYVDDSVQRARQTMGFDYWPYGFESNRNVLEVFTRHHYSQGLSARKIDPIELFAPTTLEATVI